MFDIHYAILSSVPKSSSDQVQSCLEVLFFVWFHPSHPCFLLVPFTHDNALLASCGLRRALRMLCPVITEAERAIQAESFYLRGCNLCIWELFACKDGA
jgi:hypothetical protein